MLANNLLPLIQVGRAVGLHPFGGGTRVAALLAAGCFGVLPQLIAAVTGSLILAVLVAVAAYAAGAWRWRDHLALDAFTQIRRTR
jgi:hypothetical protein